MRRHFGARFRAALAAICLAASFAGPSADAAAPAGPQGGQPAEALGSAATPRPRLYIHISSESQRPGAQRFRNAVDNALLAGTPIQALGPDLQPGSGVKQTEVRCFTSADCALASGLAVYLGKVLGLGKLPVQDLTKRYADTNAIRPFHYEIWFDGRPIQAFSGVPTEGPASKSDTPGVVPITVSPDQPPPIRSISSNAPSDSPSGRAGGAATVEFSVTIPYEPVFDAGLRDALQNVLLMRVQDGQSLDFQVVGVTRAPEQLAPDVKLDVRAIVKVPTDLEPSLFDSSRYFDLVVADRRDSGSATSFSGLTVLPTELNEFVRLAVPLIGFIAAGVGAFWAIRVQLPHLLRAWRLRDARKLDAQLSGATGRTRRVSEKDLPDLPLELLAAVASGSAVIVIGSGLAELVGVPTLSRVARSLARNAARNSDGDELSSVDLQLTDQQAVDALLGALPRDQVLAEAARQFGRPADTSLHAQLLDAPWRGAISLSLDALPDQALRRARRPWRTWTLDDGVEMADALRGAEPFLLKALGDLTRPSTVLFTASELQRQMYRASEAQRALNFLMQSTTFVFVGVSASEMQTLLTAIAPTARGAGRHYALVPEGPETDLLQLSMRQYAVELLRFAPDASHAAVQHFASSLPRTGSPDHGLRPTSSAAYVEGVSLRNIGAFEALDMTFTDGWTVMFGGNGVGKSTVLRAIALVLAGDDPAANAVGRRLLRTGATSGSITVRMGGTTLTTELHRDRAAVRVSPLQVSPVQAGAALVLGFPALRGAPSASPRGPSRLAAVGPHVGDVTPLVTGAVDDRLGAFKQWLVNILVEARDGQREALSMKELLEKLVKAMVPGDVEAFGPISSPDFEIFLSTSDGDVPFDSLSQGMASVFNWLGVLVQRLYDVYPDRPTPHQEPAVVLIDEIDSHLHPEWQRHLVELTKANFPKVQLLATSHSPLLAGALAKGEVCVLQRRPGGKVRVLKDIDVRGKRSQEILRSEVFGLRTDRDPETEREIKRYFAAYEKVKKTREDHEVIAELEPMMTSIGYGEPAPDPVSGLTPADIEKLKALKPLADDSEVAT